MQYILTDDFQAISESAGTVVNISNVPAEISTSQSHGTGIILFPRKHLGFDKSIYAARAPGYIGTAVIATIATSSGSSGGGGGGSVTPDDGGGFTDDDVAYVLGENEFTFDDVDDVFNNSDYTATGEFTQDDINDVFK